MLENDLQKKKIKLEQKEYDRPLFFCNLCQAHVHTDPETLSCMNCGSIDKEIDFQLEEKFGEKSKYVPYGQTYWALQRYDVEVSREYLIRRHIKDLSCKIEIPDFMQRNVEALIKKLVHKNASLAKSLKNLCLACIFLNMRQKDPSYSIKNFSEKANIKPKTIQKHMNTIKPYFFEDEKIFVSSSSRTNQSSHEIYLCNFIQKLDLKELLSMEIDMNLSLLSNGDRSTELIKAENVYGSALAFPHQGLTTYDNACEKMENAIRSKLKKYGMFLLNCDLLSTMKYGKNVNNFVISLIVVIFRAFSIPITMKRLCELEDISLISISRLTKEISLKLTDEYMNQLELLSTTQQTFDSTQSSALSEDKEQEEQEDKSILAKGKALSNKTKKSKNEEILKKAIKLLYKKYPNQN